VTGTLGTTVGTGVIEDVGEKGAGVVSIGGKEGAEIELIEVDGAIIVSFVDDGNDWGVGAGMTGMFDCVKDCALL
jgi:hypothetical protein